MTPPKRNLQHRAKEMARKRIMTIVRKAYKLAKELDIHLYLVIEDRDGNLSEFRTNQNPAWPPLHKNREIIKAPVLDAQIRSEMSVSPLHIITEDHFDCITPPVLLTSPLDRFQ